MKLPKINRSYTLTELFIVAVTVCLWTAMFFFLGIYVFHFLPYHFIGHYQQNFKAVIP
jgi:hypothetical protein